jgi:hypothetical protein
VGQEIASVSDTLWQRWRLGGRRLTERTDWPRFAGRNWADHIMTVAVTDRFHAKQGRSTGRWILDRDGQSLSVYLKRHYRLPWWRGLLALVLPTASLSPALQEMRNLRWARQQGFAVPDVVAAGQFVGPGMQLQSFLAVEELRGMLPLHEAIPLAARQLEPLAFRRWKRSLTAEVARIVTSLHRRSCYHKDLYLCHFYVSVADTARVVEWNGGVHLIDLHRLARHSWTWLIWQVKDLAQLLYSSDVQGVGAGDRLRFWRYYQGNARRGLLASWTRWAVVWKCRRYRRHNRKRRGMVG